ncbi:MAG: N-acetyl-gamma-glutamyl-phosphate reductase [Acidimicrobiales bacterium]
MKVGVVGASGYAGGEVLRLCAGHPELEVAVACAGGQVGRAVGEHTPSLLAAYPSMVYEAPDPATLDGLDLVFLALPHGQSQRLVPAVADRVGAVVDLAADFRLTDPELYPRWYGEPHAAPELLGRFAYGLPELFRPAVVGSRLVAAPGCYPTAAALALAPLVRAGVVERNGIVVDAASGVSGAGRTPTEALHFGAVDGSFTAYGLLDHRHTPEIEQAIGAEVLFTPHLAPMSRGILATCYARPSVDLTTDDALAILRAAYADERFAVVVDGPPATKSTAGSNMALVTVRVDGRTGWLVALCALDNLVKGAAGQAVQCANLMLGLPEDLGLPVVGTAP